MAEVVRLSARQQQPAQDRGVGLGVDLDSRCGRDRLGRRVGLLRREPTLLDRVGRAVARGVDVLGAQYPAMAVGRDEAGHALGDPADHGSAHRR